MSNPGWFNNPDGTPSLRWWDGTQWTADTQPATPQPPHQSTTPPSQAAGTPPTFAAPHAPGPANTPPAFNTNTPPATPIPASTPPSFNAPTAPAPANTPPAFSANTPTTTAPPSLNHKATNTPQRSAPGNKLAWIAATVGALILLGGAGVFALSAATASGGGETPDDTVQSMVQAIEASDLISIAELIEPAERAAFVDPVIGDLLPSLKRLGLLDDDANPGSVNGVDADLASLEFDIRPVPGHNDLRAVWIVAGAPDLRFDLDQLPIQGLLDPDRTQQSDLDRLSGDAYWIDQDYPLMLVERDGLWYFSPAFTLAEAYIANEFFGESIPDGPKVITPIGAVSPSEAVRQFARHGADLDLEAAIARFSPNEADALQRYAPIFIGEAQSELDYEFGIAPLRYSADATLETNKSGNIAEVRTTALEFNGQFGDARVSGTYSSDEVNIRVFAPSDGEDFSATLRRNSFELRGTFNWDESDVVIKFDPPANAYSLEGVFDFDAVQVSVELGDPICTSYYVLDSFSEEAGCLEDELDVSTACFIRELLSSQNGFGVPELPRIVTEEVDGEWYISPARTIAANTTDVVDTFANRVGPARNKCKESRSGDPLLDALDRLGLR